MDTAQTRHESPPAGGHQNGSLAAGAVSPAQGAARWRTRVRRVLDRPRLWRVTTGLAALILVALMVAAGQGSLTIVRSKAAGAGHAPHWTRWCARARARLDRRHLAFCARVDGIVIARTHGPDPRESHVAVLGDFHLTIVRVPDGSPAPGFGARISAVGPLVRARDGQREVDAFSWSAR